MSDQDNGQVSTLQRPNTDDKDAWKAYWKAQGCPWRKEPEIDADRQKYLAERRAIVPDIEKGIYPFKDIKLSRADVEWLLATHEDGRGPIDWTDEKQQNRIGIDLRGADLRQVNLSWLPLSCTVGGLRWDEWKVATEEQRNLAGVHLERAILEYAHLEWVRYRRAYLEGASLRDAHLEKARLFQAHLESVDFFRAHLEGANLRRAFLQKADLRLVYFDSATTFDHATLSDKKYGVVSFVDVRWEGINLSIVDWTSINMLGNELDAHQRTTFDGRVKRFDERRDEYQRAVRANRQLAVALQSQGLNENAAYFAYRAQLCQRVILCLQKKFGQYLFSLFLDLLAGYGYRPGRSVLWYLAVIFGFALAYFTIGHLPFFPDAFVFSLTSFHGRGFFPGLGNDNSLHNPLVIMAAFEAVIGLLIEISFIATFTQRFFGR